MRVKSILKISWHNLSSKRFQAIFRISGLFIATIVITLAFAISFGVDNIVSREMSRNASDRKISVTSSANGLVKIDQNTVKNISLYEGVESVEQLAEISGKISYSGSTTDVLAEAVTSGYFASTGILLPSGVELKSVENGEPNPIIINSALAKVFGFKNPKDFLGQEVYLDLILNRQNSEKIIEKNGSEEQTEIGKFRIVAVINNASKPVVYLPHKVALDNGISYNSYIWPTVQNSSQLFLLRAKIENLGLETSGATDAISELKRFFFLLRLGITILSVVMLVIAGISMISSAKEEMSKRSKEIAFQKTIGIDDKIILMMLFSENLYLVIIGFISGFSVSIILGELINIVFKRIAINSYYQYYPLFIIPWSLVVFLILTMVLFVVAISINSKVTVKNILAKDNWSSG
ncbi:MAG: ABC transporter permease [Chloroflexi bacterium]|nr:ABC transporter permease [Chloroflexota bacterium]